MALHGGGAEAGAHFENVLLGELAELVLDGVLDGVDGGGADDLDAIVEVAVCGDDRTEQVFDEGCGIILLLMPADLRVLQRRVVCVLVLCDLGFQRDILTDFVSCAVEEKRREQT